MRRLKAQFALAYAVEGALLPFVPLYLRHVQGLSEAQLGTVLAAGSLAVLITPVLLSALADAHVNQRWLLGGALAASGGLFALLAVSPAYPVTLLVFAVFSLAYEPVKPLQDAHFFAVRRAHGWATPFSAVRVWGTLGFIAPGAALFFLLPDDAAVAVIVPLVVVLSLATAANALRLPETGRSGVPALVGPQGRGHGTLRAAAAAIAAAARHLRRPPLLLLVAAMLCLQIAAAGYMAFYPLYLTESVGIASRWVGLVSGFGVAVEIGYMLGFTWLLRRLGWRWFMVLGTAAHALRMLALGLWPAVPIAVGTQLVHGLVVVAAVVAARVLLDRMAEEGHRYALHGLYTVLVVGGGRILGNLAAGALASISLSVLFLAGAALSFVGVALIALAFRHAPLADLDPAAA